MKDCLHACSHCKVKLPHVMGSLLQIPMGLVVVVGLVFNAAQFPLWNLV